MEIRWSLPAAEDLERICERIEHDNPEAAGRVSRAVYDGCARLKDFPHLGRASRRVTGSRELVFAPLPYIVVYHVTENAVEISRLPRAAYDAERHHIRFRCALHRSRAEYVVPPPRRTVRKIARANSAAASGATRSQTAECAVIDACRAATNPAERAIKAA